MKKKINNCAGSECTVKLYTDVFLLFTKTQVNNMCDNTWCLCFCVSYTYKTMINCQSDSVDNITCSISVQHLGCMLF